MVHQFCCAMEERYGACESPDPSGAVAVNVGSLQNTPRATPKHSEEADKQRQQAVSLISRQVSPAAETLHTVALGETLKKKKCCCLGCAVQ